MLFCFKSSSRNRHKVIGHFPSVNPPADWPCVRIQRRLILAVSWFDWRRNRLIKNQFTAKTNQQMIRLYRNSSSVRFFSLRPKTRRISSGNLDGAGFEGRFQFRSHTGSILLAWQSVQLISAWLGQSTRVHLIFWSSISTANQKHVHEFPYSLVEADFSAAVFEFEHSLVFCLPNRQAVSTFPKA